MSRRFPPLRAHFIPKGAVKFADKSSSAVVYAYERSGKLLLLGFSGKRQRPDFHYSYGTNAKRREEKASSFFVSVRLSEAFRLEQKTKRKAEGHSLKVGSILRASWGYDQTNIDYYEVTALIGAKMVEIRQIRAESEGEWTGKSVPLPGSYYGEPMRKLAQGNGVRIASYAWANLMEPTLVGGVPTYDASNWTAYA